MHSFLCQVKKCYGVLKTRPKNVLRLKERERQIAGESKREKLRKGAMQNARKKKEGEREKQAEKEAWQTRMEHTFQACISQKRREQSHRS